MTQPSSHPPIPPHSVGTTFKVAAGLLIAFLVFQMLAIVWHFLPGIQKKLVKEFTAEPSVAAAPETTSTPVPTPQTEVQSTAEATSQPDNALVEQIRVLVAESDTAFRIGDHDVAMDKISKAEKLLPEDPGIMLRIGRIFEKTGNSAAAAEIYRGVLELADLPKDLRAQTRRKLSMLSVPEGTPAPTVVAAEEGADMRDQFGLQPGATLGIVDTRLEDGSDGTKTLRIAIKGRPDKNIDTNETAVHVFFYDRDANGEVHLTDSKIITEWISPPVDWGENEPELLNAAYTPPAKPDNQGSSTSYEGYVVGVYYNSELQDTRAAPGSLANEHPLPLYLTTQNQ